MQTSTVDDKLTMLREELRKADEELSKLRPRVQYLEAMMHRLDGAITVLEEMRASLGSNHQVASGG